MLNVSSFISERNEPFVLIVVLTFAAISIVFDGLKHILLKQTLPSVSSCVSLKVRLQLLLG